MNFVDFTADPRKNINGVEMNYLMQVQDYVTRLSYLCAIPSKEVTFVAQELNNLCALIGYPKILHIDDGQGCPAADVIHALKTLNANLAPVAGRRPGIPSSHGGAREVIDVLSAKRLTEGQSNVSWVDLIPEAMTALNTYIDTEESGRQPYKAVFGMRYDEPVQVSFADLRKCNTVEDRVALLGEEEWKRMIELGEIAAAAQEVPVGIDEPTMEEIAAVAEAVVAEPFEEAAAGGKGRPAPKGKEPRAKRLKNTAKV